MGDDFLLYEGDERGRPSVSVPAWLHHLLTAVGIVLWIIFAAWANLDGVIALLGVGLLLYLRRMDWFGY